MKKRLISLILSITIVGSVFASSFTVTAVGGWLDTAKTFGMNKVLILVIAPLQKQPIWL